MKTPGHNLNLRHLRIFMQVGEAGSINQVAQKLNVSQPSISIALTGIETFFGAKMLTRRNLGSGLTSHGQVLFARLKRMDRQLSSALAQAQGAASQRDPGAAGRSLQRITLRQIRALILVANASSITEAAQGAGSSPATLHRLLHELQANVGRAILDRGPRGVTPNLVGQRLALGWQVALTEIDQARDELREMDGRMEGRVKVASLPLARTLLLARAINPLLDEHPDARVEIADGSYEMLSRNLRAGYCDILIGALRSGAELEGLRTEVLFEDPYAIVARPDHPLLKRGRRVELGELAAMDWVAQRQGTPVRAAFDRLFGEGRIPKASIETSSLVLTRAIILESDRLSMLSFRQIAVDEQEGILRCVPVSRSVSGRMGSRTIGITMREEWLPSRLQAVFLDHVREVAAAMRDDTPFPSVDGPVRQTRHLKLSGTI